MSDPTTRIANWKAGMTGDAVSPFVAAKLATMTANVEAMFPLICTMETAVKQVLDGEGVATIQYPFYLCFGRQMFKLQRREISGESLAQEAAVLVALWVGRGLTQSVLETIRTQVFNVLAPTP